MMATVVQLIFKKKKKTIVDIILDWVVVDGGYLPPVQSTETF